MSFVPVARVSEIPSDRGLRVVLDPDPSRAAAPAPGTSSPREPERGIAIGLYRIGDQIYAMEDACPHAGFPLSKGRFEACVVVCSAHAWAFDVRTGFDPKNPDGFPIPCFEVRVVGDQVEVDLDTRTNDPRRMRPA